MKEEPTDFRDMTIQDLRRNISAFNRNIAALRGKAEKQTKKFFWGEAAALGALVPAALVAPPVAAGVTAFGLAYGAGAMAQDIVIAKRLSDVKTLRDQFKTVYRARPGRPFRDFEARARREKARNAAKKGRGFGRSPE
jgi:hypothetical protein